MTVGRVKYPEVEYPDDLEIWPDGFKYYVVFVEEKRDGSQVCIWFDGEKDRISSRNQDTAALADKVAVLPEVSKWVSFIHGVTKYVVFGEYIQAGYGPTKVEGYNDRDVFVVFDIYDRELRGFLWPQVLMEIVSGMDVPMVSVLHVFDREDGVIEKSEKIVKNLSNREGVVLKIYYPQLSVMSYVAKIKNPAIIEKEKVKKDRKKVGDKEAYDKSLPVIPDDKIYRAVNNCFHTEFGGDVESFKDKGRAMPLVVEYVKLECREYGFSMPKGNKIYSIYVKYIEDRDVI